VKSNYSDLVFSRPHRISQDEEAVEYLLCITHEPLVNCGVSTQLAALGLVDLAPETGLHKICWYYSDIERSFQKLLDSTLT